LGNSLIDRVLPLAVLLVLALGCTQERGPSEAPIQFDAAAFRAVPEVLKSASDFGFTPAIGEGTRRTDTALRHLLCHPNAKALFRVLFEEGNTPGKLYSLFALHYIDPQAFRYLAREIDHAETVPTKFGCIVDGTTAGRIITAIESGKYDYYYRRFSDVTQRRRDAEQEDARGR